MYDIHSHAMNGNSSSSLNWNCYMVAQDVFLEHACRPYTYRVEMWCKGELVHVHQKDDPSQDF